MVRIRPFRFCSAYVGTSYRFTILYIRITEEGGLKKKREKKKLIGRPVRGET